MLHNTHSLAHSGYGYTAQTHLYITGATANNYGVSVRVQSRADSADRGPIAERAQRCTKGDKLNCM